MAIIKIIKRECPFVTIDKTGIDDPNLSWGATGLLTYLIGRPSNWKINVAHLSSVKTCKETATKTVLKELREANYCHYFVVRKNGKISETFYLVFEVPTNYEEILEDYIDLKEGETILYQPVKMKEKNSKNLEKKLPQVENQLSEKDIENKEILPQVDFPLVENLKVENQGLIIIDSNNNRMNKIKNHDHDLSDDLNEIKNFFNKIGIDFSEKHKEKIIELLKKNSKDYLLSFFKRQYEILSKKENVKSIAAIMSNHLFNNTCETDRDFIEKKEKNIQKNSKKNERNEERILKNTEEMEKFNEESNLIIEKLQTLNKEKQEEILNEAEKRRIEKVPMTAATLPLLRSEKQVYCRILMKDIKEILLEKRLL